MKKVIVQKDLFQTIFETSKEPILVYNEYSHIVTSNPACNRLFGFETGELLGKNIKILFSDDFGLGLLEKATSIKNPEIHGISKDGRKFSVRIRLCPTETGTIVFLQENNEPKIDSGNLHPTYHEIKEEYLKDQTRIILEAIVQNNSLKTIANKIVVALETNFKNCLASVLLLDEEQKTLRQLAAPNLPKAFSTFIEKGLRVGPKSGSSGTAAFLGKEIIVTNIETNILWEDFKEIGKNNNIKACWSYPILSSTRKSLGTIALYCPVSRQPSGEEKKVLIDMTQLASIAIENYTNTLALKSNRKKLEKHAQKLEQKVEERTREVMATVQKLVESNLNLEDQFRITKLAEREALTSKSIASEIAKNFPNGFVVVMNKDSKVEFAEGDALVQLGLKQIFYEGMTVDDVTVFSERRKELIKENIKKTLAGEHLSFVVNYKSRYFTVNTAPLVDENNKIINALHVYNDITHQKEIEFAIQRALTKEQELNELKSRFISMASHEFRTPLSAILTSAILIGKQNGQGKEQKREKYLAQIERNVNNLTVILNDFLSLSKLEEGEVVATPERFDLVSFSNSLISEANIGLRKGQQIKIATNGENLLVNLDKKLLSHIINNLLSNASKYSPEDSIIDLKLYNKKNTVTIEVKDQGIGIPKEEQARLFSRFFRAKNAANIEGTGLGLNIVKQYTELMGGTIGFKSDINKGTTFLVELPTQIE